MLDVLAWWRANWPRGQSAQLKGEKLGFVTVDGFHTHCSVVTWWEQRCQLSHVLTRGGTPLASAGKEPRETYDWERRSGRDRNPGNLASRELCSTALGAVIWTSLLIPQFIVWVGGGPTCRGCVLSLRSAPAWGWRWRRMLQQRAFDVVALQLLLPHAAILWIHTAVLCLWRSPRLMPNPKEVGKKQQQRGAHIANYRNSGNWNEAKRGLRSTHPKASKWLDQQAHLSCRSNVGEAYY